MKYAGRIVILDEVNGDVVTYKKTHEDQSSPVVGALLNSNS